MRTETSTVTFRIRATL